MKLLHLMCLLGLNMLTVTLQSQDCVPVTVYSIQACVQQPSLHKASLQSSKRAETNSLEGLFYKYFEGTDYAGYKSLFLTADWYGLPESEFKTWRTFIRNAELNIIGSVEASISGKIIGVIKYTYIIDDMLYYETFLAKKSGSKWHPVSTKEERDLMGISRMIRSINLQYLTTLTTDEEENVSGKMKGMVTLDEIMIAKDSLRAFSPDEFKAYFNPDFEYRTNTKYKEDRKNDPVFVSFLEQMQLNPEQVSTVMKYLSIQDYLLAAQKADEYSPASYTYVPFVDKIREVYGRDRLRKWDNVNQKWD